MSDLISRSALIEQLKENLDDRNIQDSLEFFGVYDIINSQPTAYNVDKVVEQLKGYTWWTEAKYDEDGFCCEEPEEVICLEDAIKIVKAGGVE